MATIMSKISEMVKKIQRKIDVEIKSKLKIMTYQETIRYIIDNNASVARYGDGEFKLMVDAQSLRFQPYSDELRAALTKVIEEPPENLLVCVSRALMDVNTSKEYNDRAREFWKKWRWFHLPETVRYIKACGGGSYVFGDTLITRPYIDYIKCNRASVSFSMLKELWDGKEIIFVEGNETRLGIGNDLFDNAASIKRIIAPNKDAFSVYDRILKSVKENYNGELVLLALGPTATVLAADLCRAGIRAIDVGHIDIEYEWYLRQAEDKIQIEGKYVNEVHNSYEVDVCTDKNYLKQIIDKIELQ